jgi:hypothetical protein
MHKSVNQAFKNYSVAAMIATSVLIEEVLMSFLRVKWNRRIAGIDRLMQDSLSRTPIETMAISSRGWRREAQMD